MTENVKVIVIGTHNMEGVGEDTVKSTAAGQYYLKNEKSYVIFEEEQEGFAEKVKTMVKFTDHKVELTKTGLIRSQMVFEQGVAHITDYVTPYGVMKMEVNTDSLLVLQTEDYIRIDIVYTLSMGGEECNHSKIVIKIKPVS